MGLSGGEGALLGLVIGGMLRRVLRAGVVEENWAIELMKLLPFSKNLRGRVFAG